MQNQDIQIDSMSDLSCKEAAITAFSKLRAKGVDFEDALGSATTILCLRHPEINRHKGTGMVLDWLENGQYI